MDRRAELAHRNLMAFNRFATERTPGGRIEERDEEQLVSSPHPLPFVNMAVRDHDRNDADGLLDRAADFFFSGGQPGGSDGFVVCARATEEDANLERAAESMGMQLVLEHYPEMACDHPVAMPSLNGDVELREVEDAEAARQYWQICGHAYPSLGFPGDLFEVFAPELLLHEAVSACIALVDGNPAACALVAVLDGVGFIGWVATLEQARGRGLGEAVTVWATNRGLEEGAQFAALQASPMGEPIYARMGYEELFNYHLWLATPP
jgi:GNAT superfamily N-acetyltransferase